MSYKEDKKFSAEDFISFDSIDDLSNKDTCDSDHPYYIRNYNQNDSEGYTPLCAAILYNADPVMLLYLTSVVLASSSSEIKKEGLDPSINYLPKQLRKTKNADIKKACDKGKTPLQIAIMSGNISAIKVLLGTYIVTICAQQEVVLRSHSYYKDVVKYNSDYSPIYAKDEDGNTTDQYEYAQIRIKLNNNVSGNLTITSSDILEASSLQKPDILNAIADSYTSSWGLLKDALGYETTPILLATKAQCYESVKRIIKGLTGENYSTSPSTSVKENVKLALEQESKIDNDRKVIEVIKIDNKDIGLEKLLAPYCLIVGSEKEYKFVTSNDFSFLEAAFKWGDIDYIIDFILSRFDNNTKNIFNWSYSTTNLLFYKFAFGDPYECNMSVLDIINNNLDDLYDILARYFKDSCSLSIFTTHFTKTSDFPDTDTPLYNLINRLYTDGLLSDTFIESVCDVTDYTKLHTDFHRKVGLLKRCKRNCILTSDYWCLSGFTYDTDSKLWLNPTQSSKWSSPYDDNLYEVGKSDSPYTCVTLINGKTSFKVSPKKFAMYNNKSGRLYNVNFDPICTCKDGYNSILVKTNPLSSVPISNDIYTKDGTYITWNTDSLLYSLLHNSNCYFDDSKAEIIFNNETLSLVEGNSTTRSFKLSTKPSDVVTLKLSSSNNSRLKISNDELIFTPSDWYTDKSVTFTAIDDFIQNDNVIVTIIVGAISNDTRYNDITDSSLYFTVIDNDTAGINYDATSFTLIEGDSLSRTFKLRTKPASTVTLSFTNKYTDRLTISPTSLLFSPDDWDTQKDVLFTAVDNTIYDGDVTDTISIVAKSYDLLYNDIVITPITITVKDNDTKSFGTLAFESGYFTVDINPDYKLPAINQSGSDSQYVKTQWSSVYDAGYTIQQVPKSPKKDHPFEYDLIYDKDINITVKD